MGSIQRVPFPRKKNSPESPQGKQEKLAADRFKQRNMSRLPKAPIFFIRLQEFSKVGSSSLSPRKQGKSIALVFPSIVSAERKSAMFPG
jgi:hypothetical protein